MLPVERQLHRLDGLEMPLQAEQDLTLLVRGGELRFRNSHNLPSRELKEWGVITPLALSLSKGSLGGSTGSPRTGQTNAHELHPFHYSLFYTPPL